MHAGNKSIEAVLCCISNCNLNGGFGGTDNVQFDYMKIVNFEIAKLKSSRISSRRGMHAVLKVISYKSELKNCNLDMRILG